MLDRVVAIIREVAQEVVLPRFRNLTAADIAEKEPGDLVTVADRAAEVALATRLTSLLPGSLVVGEEETSADAGVLDRLAAPGPVWVVDPIDGTGNYAAGREPFAVMVALVRAGAPVLSVIYQPVTDLVAAAELGSGAYLDGTRVRLPEAAGPATQVRGAMYLRYLPAPLREQVAARVPELGAQVPVRHCAGWEYPEVLRGSRDFLLFWRAKPWDHLPGALLIREAGGTVRHFDGAQYLANRPQLGLLACRSEEIFQVVRKVLLE